SEPAFFFGIIVPADIDKTTLSFFTLNIRTVSTVNRQTATFSDITDNLVPRNWIAAFCQTNQKVINSLNRNTVVTVITFLFQLRTIRFWLWSLFSISNDLFFKLFFLSFFFAIRVFTD